MLLFKIIYILWQYTSMLNIGTLVFNSIVRGETFEPWMSPLEIPRGASWATRLLAGTLFFNILMLNKVNWFSLWWS